MEFKFTIKPKNIKLIKENEYPLFYYITNTSEIPDKIGTCEMTINNNSLNCIGNIIHSKITHSLNNSEIGTFERDKFIPDKYNFEILTKTDNLGNEIFYGILIVPS